MKNDDDDDGQIGSARQYSVVHGHGSGDDGIVPGIAKDRQGDKGNNDEGIVPSTARGRDGDSVGGPSPPFMIAVLQKTVAGTSLILGAARLE